MIDDVESGEGGGGGITCPPPLLHNKNNQTFFVDNLLLHTGVGKYAQIWKICLYNVKVLQNKRRGGGGGRELSAPPPTFLTCQLFFGRISALRGDSRAIYPFPPLIVYRGIPGCPYTALVHPG